MQDVVLPNELLFAADYARDHPVLRDKDDARLRRRYASEPKSNVVEYEFTRDEGLLHQYFRLREEMFISVWGLHHFSGVADRYDLIGDTLVARVGKQCVAGARVTYSTPELPVALPMEGADFRLMDILGKELDLKNKTYAECSRVAVGPDFRAREISSEICRLISEHCAMRGVDYLFWIAPMLQTRNNRQIFAKRNIACKVRMDVPLPDREEYEGIRMYLTQLDLAPIRKMLSLSGAGEAVLTDA